MICILKNDAKIDEKNTTEDYIHCNKETDSGSGDRVLQQQTKRRYNMNPKKHIRLDQKQLADISTNLSKMLETSLIAAVKFKRSLTETNKGGKSKKC